MFMLQYNHFSAILCFLKVIFLIRQKTRLKNKLSYAQGFLSFHRILVRAQRTSCFWHMHGSLSASLFFYSVCCIVLLSANITCLVIKDSSFYWVQNFNKVADQRMAIYLVFPRRIMSINVTAQAQQRLCIVVSLKTCLLREVPYYSVVVS